MSYQDFLNFTVSVFARKSQSIRPEKQSAVDVDFVNTYKSFKTRSMKNGLVENGSESLKEECRAKISYFSDK